MDWSRIGATGFIPNEQRAAVPAKEATRALDSEMFIALFNAFPAGRMSCGPDRVLQLLQGHG